MFHLSRVHTVLKVLLQLLFIRLYKHDSRYKPCHAVGSQLFNARLSRHVKNGRTQEESSSAILHHQSMTRGH